MPTYQRGDYIKVEFPDETTGVGEWLWVRVHHCDDEKKLVFGTLDKMNQSTTTTVNSMSARNSLSAFRKFGNTRNSPPFHGTHNPGEGALFVYPAFPHTQHAPSLVPQSTSYSHISVCDSKISWISRMSYWSLTVGRSADIHARSIHRRRERLWISATRSRASQRPAIVS